MTKGELLKVLENVPDDFEINVCTLDSYGMVYEPPVVSVEIDNDIQTVYFLLEEEDVSC